MLRMYFVQRWSNLADVACEDALPDSPALRRFVGLSLAQERVPDATTLLKLRRRLEDHKPGEALFTKVGQVLQAEALKVGTGTIVDATIVGAPSSTKNADKQRDPKMHQTGKGQQWYLRHETAHRRGHQDGPCAQRGCHAGRRSRQAPAAPVAAGAAGARVRRLCLRGRASDDPGQGAAGLRVSTTRWCASATSPRR